MTPKQIVKEYFPDLDDHALEHVLWGCTGFPYFWPKDGGTAEECCRKQLQETKEYYLKHNKLPGDNLDGSN
jgi:hypothetical protein